MRCIFCLEERPESEEHVFPMSIGGSLVTRRVCSACNSFLGSKIDTGLTEFGPILWRRGDLGIAGHSGKPPSRFNMFNGIGKLADDSGRRVRIKYNEASKKIDITVIRDRRETYLSNGVKTVRIIIDESEKSSIPKIVQRERKRHGLSPLTEADMDSFLSTLELETIENPTLNIESSIDFSFLRHAYIKIVYELAFIWLGENYLDDPLAALMREAVIAAAPGSADNVIGSAEFIPERSVFAGWELDPTHHLAYAAQVEENIVIAVRIFDLMEANFIVTNQARKYLKQSSRHDGLFFLAMDSLSGVMHKSSFREETKRLDNLVRIYLRNPPFPDPLTTEREASSAISCDGFSCPAVRWHWGWSWLPFSP